MPSEEEPSHERLVSALREHFAQVAFEKAWEEGKAIDLEQTVALALEDGGEAGHDNASGLL